jgi:hypothetical protein
MGAPPGGAQVLYADTSTRAFQKNKLKHPKQANNITHDPKFAHQTISHMWDADSWQRMLSTVEAGPVGHDNFTYGQENLLTSAATLQVLRAPHVRLLALSLRVDNMHALTVRDVLAVLPRGIGELSAAQMKELVQYDCPPFVQPPLSEMAGHGGRLKARGSSLSAPRAAVAAAVDRKLVPWIVPRLESWNFNETRLVKARQVRANASQVL